jgi:non-specific serine/threonine protein kinase/serine/threonine-protein kinase
MTPEHWQRIKQVLHEALPLGADERARLLARLRETAPDISDEVTSLLSAHDAATASFIETPAVAETVGRDVLEAMDGTRTWAGRRIGPYVIEREIGHGGMGIVYLASRADESFRHRVAIKVVRGHFAGEAMHQRFRLERQILADLDHPHIARLIDGGALEDGSPYVVMEYVEGQSIDRFCEAHDLDVAARLTLFRRVCAAVHYAHQHLVVHRDLKARNILVTADGVPKLLDFGIAKLIDSGAAADETATRLMTLESASPEQVRGETITTATDVYALGVMLYGLVTGRSPYDVPAQTPHELTRAILDDEPNRPSATAPETVRRSLASRRWRELDAIILKALRKEPSRRYSGVDQLDDDLDRFLQGLPVEAVPDSAGYRLRKFAVRHRGAVAGTAAVMLALIVGLVATMWQARIAQRERARAEQRFSDVRKLARAVIFDMHDAIAALPGSTEARKLLVTNALEYLDSLAQEAGGDRELQRELATAYEKVGDVQGRPNSANIGDLQGARQSYQKAQAIRTALGGEHAPDASLRREMAGTSRKLTSVLWFTGDREPAITEARRALTIDEAEFAATPGDAERLNLAISYDYLAYSFGLAGQSAECMAYLEKAEALLRPIATLANPDAYDMLSTVYGHMGDVLNDGAPVPGLIPDPAAAVAMYRKELAINEELARAEPRNLTRERNVMVGHIHVADALQKVDRAGALAQYQQVLPIANRIVESDPNDASAVSDQSLMYERVGTLLLDTGRIDEGLASLRRSLAIIQPLLSSDPTNYMTRARAAATERGLGRALLSYARDSRRDPATRERHYQEARRFLTQTQAFWRDIQTRSPDVQEAGTTLVELEQTLAAIDRELAALSPQPPG